MSKKPLTDDDIRRQLKEVRGTLALLSTTLQGLEEQLDEREKAKKLEANRPAANTSAPVANNAAPKDPASKPVVVDIQPRTRYGFLLPKGLTGNFNSARSLVETMAVPNYLDDVKPQDLADFRTVVAALAAAPAQKANRSIIFLPDLKKYMMDDMVKDVDNDPSMREAMDILQGKSRMGFNLAVLKARTRDNKPALLYVLQDTQRQSMIVAGPERISAGLKQQLAKGGVEYVVKSDEECIDRINAFVEEGVKQRGNSGSLLMGSKMLVVEGLIKAFAAVCELSDLASPIVSKGVSLGWVLHSSKGEPAAFTHIRRPGMATP